MGSAKKKKSISKLLAFLSAAFGVFIVCLSLFFWMQLEAYQDRQASERISAAKYNDSNYNEHYQWCVEIPDVLERVNCLTKQKEAQQESKRSKYDLRAQQEMSQWALGMLFASVIALMLNIVGILAILLTLRETRNMTVATREIGQKQVKAYLTCVGGSFCVDDEMLVVRPKFKNFGNSPAVLVQVGQIEIFLSIAKTITENRDEIYDELHMMLQGWQANIVSSIEDLGPNDTENACFEFPLSVSGKERKGLFRHFVGKETAILWISGSFVYQDVFNNFTRKDLSLTLSPDSDASDADSVCGTLDRNQ